MIGGSEVWPSGKRLVSFRGYGVGAEWGQEAGGAWGSAPGAGSEGGQGWWAQTGRGREGRAVGRGQKNPSCDPR